MLIITTKTRPIPLHRCRIFKSATPRGNLLLRSFQEQGTVRPVTPFHQSCASFSKASTSLPKPKSAACFFPSATTTAISLLATLANPTATMTLLALCDSESNNNNDDDFIAKIRSKLESQSFSFPSEDETLNSIAASLGSQVSSAIATGVPTDLSYGFLAGYLSGLALKKVGKVASIALGCSFLALQSLAYAGYIDVHHDKLQKQVEEMLDRNNDGVVDCTDLRSVLEDVRKVAGFGLEDKSLVASTGGFGLGFWGGLRS